MDVALAVNATLAFAVWLAVPVGLFVPPFDPRQVQLVLPPAVGKAVLLEVPDAH